MECRKRLTKQNVYQQAFAFSLSALKIAERNSIDQFKPKIFELLKKYIYIDAGQWVTRAMVDADNKRIHPSGAYLESLSNTKLIDYQPHIQHDHLFSTAIQYPNITHDIRTAWPKYFSSKVYREYGKKYELERILCTLVYHQHSNFSQVISLYRKQRINLFSEYERLFVELACQYMTPALRLNILKNVAGNIKQPKGKPKAVTDADGFIFEADSSFLNWLQQQYPDFDGYYLPPSLLHKNNTQRNIEKDFFALSVKQVGGLFLVSRISLLNVDKLSTKEKQVILSLMQGGSNKVIARKLNNKKTTIDKHLSNIYEKVGFSKSMDNHKKRQLLTLLALESPQLNKSNKKQYTPRQHSRNFASNLNKNQLI